jgi:hypothetical protein
VVLISSSESSEKDPPHPTNVSTKQKSPPIRQARKKRERGEYDGVIMI